MFELDSLGEGEAYFRPAVMFSRANCEHNEMNSYAAQDVKVELTIMSEVGKALTPFFGKWTCFTRTNDLVVLLPNVTSPKTMDFLSEEFALSVPAFQSLWSRLGYGLTHSEDRYVDNLGIPPSRQHRLLVPLHDAEDFVKSHLKTAVLVHLIICIGDKCVKKQKVVLRPQPEERGEVAISSGGENHREEEGQTSKITDNNVPRPETDCAFVDDGSLVECILSAQSAHIQALCPSVESSVSNILKRQLSEPHENGVEEEDEDDGNAKKTKMVHQNAEQMEHGETHSASGVCLCGGGGGTEWVGQGEVLFFKNVRTCN